MDRVNRSLIVASTLLAVPAALLMASLTTGTTPDVQLAVGQGGDDVNAVEQVVGKQPETRITRPGLFQVISGSKSQGSTNHQHHNMSEDRPKGLLDGFFDGSQKSKTTHTTRHAKHPTRAAAVSRPPSSKSGDNVNWDGIPYHRANNSGTKTSATPIRDPVSRPASRTASTGRSTSGSTSGGTRIIRGGGSSRSVQATPASVRRSSEPTLARQPAEPLPAPTQNLAPIGSSARTFSTSSSSRRSNRRTLDALDPSEIAAAARAPMPMETKSETPKSETPISDGTGLVPKVVRKESATKSKPAQKPAAPKVVKAEAPKAEVKPAEVRPADVPSAEVATKQATEAPAAADPKPAAAPKPTTALAAIGAPTPQSQEPTSSGDIAGAEASNVAAPATPTPAYTTPVDPASTPLPIAGIPSHPYAASTPPSVNATPATVASHRAGPPNAAFGTNPIANVQQPYGQPQFNAASTPVGSGVAPNSDVASYRRPAQQPVYGAAPQPSYPSVDPYAAQPYPAAAPSYPAAAPSYPAAAPSYPAAGTYPPAQRMTTHGMPVANRTPSPTTRPAHETATIPMQPIHGYAPTAATNPAGDNFAPSTYESRNRMRDTVGGNVAERATAMSELPGIRVATRGPSSIMIRQTSQYEIRVENRGSIDATGVLVRAAVPNWAELRGQNATRGDIDTQVNGSTERLVWTIDHLPAGASEQMYVRLTAARSGTYDLDVDWTLLPQKSVAKVQVHEPRLDLTIDGPDEVVYGQSQTYKVRVLNPGDGTAPNVVFTLSPNSATPQTQRIGDIPPGKEAQFDVELTAQDLGDLKIHGLAAGDLELRAESSKTIRVAAAKLEAMLTGPELKYQNTEALYSLQVQNTGAATSEKILATLRMPSGVKYLGGIDEAVMQGTALKWEITGLAPGATRNYQFRCNMATTGEHLFAFDCKGTAAGNTDVSIATRVESIADLVLSVSDPTAPAPIGSDVTYEIVIRNRGSKEATDVRAVAQFSHGIEPQRIEGQSGEVVTGQVLFDPIPRIGAGQEVRMRVIAQADRAGHHRFRTEVRSGDTVLVAEEATHYMSPQSERVSRRSSDAAKR